MKNKRYDGALAALCIFLFCATGFAIASLCVMGGETTLFGILLEYVLAAACGVFLLCYVVTLIVCVATKRGKNRLGLSVTIVVVGTLLIALSPLAFIMWIFQTIVEKVSEKRSRRAEQSNT
ncbi:MAG: hypothetical protein NC132_05730 [Corallococcus sp.]|nr:hypothetical protein [Corallococcus sp.]MCM1360031.1 hypothetical protein [Corallococcus sp.]MCM1395588.1 hypothetical protein [Corallococcus sp.]